jgi:enterochelin esterase family protein
MTPTRRWTTRLLVPHDLPILSLLLLGLAAGGCTHGHRAENPDSQGDGHFVVWPEYRIDPDLTNRGNPQGRQFEFKMRLAGSRIFRGDDPTLEPAKKAVRTERKIFLYIPAAYRDGNAAPVLVTHDGPNQLKLVRNALDNLTVSTDPARRLPAFLVIAVENGGNDGKNSERGLEYDTMSDRFARFINVSVTRSTTPHRCHSLPSMTFMQQL